MYYWYHYPTELLVCVAFENRFYYETKIDELKEFQLFVNFVNKSYIDPTFNVDRILIKDLMNERTR